MPIADFPGGPYFAAPGLNINKLSLGFTFKITPEFAVSPSVMFETYYDTSGGFLELNYYANLTVNYTIKLY